jgi:hypothetical protein
MTTIAGKTGKNGLGTQTDVKDFKNLIPRVNKPSEPNQTTAQKVEVKTEPTQIIEAEKKEIIQVVEVQKPQLTLDQKIEKVENLKTLIEKREKLEQSRKKLQSFIIGTNNFNENIVLTDESGNKFSTSNTEVFANVVETINKTLVSKIAEIEKQIEF